MAYIQGSAIAKKNEGSLVQQAMAVDSAIAEHVDGPVEVLVTHKNHAFFLPENDQMMKATYKWSKGTPKIESVEPTTEIPVIEDEDVPLFVAGEIKAMTEAALNGKPMLRTQVREVSQLLDPEEEYWISDIVSKLAEAAEGADWFAMYESNQEKVRTDLHGHLREIEGVVPATKFSKLPESHLSEVGEELKESLTILCGVTSDIVDGCEKMVFDSDQDEFFCAIRESLKVEAQTIEGLLGKADKLMRPKDMKVVAEAHDRLAERAKTMAVVAGYLKKRSQPSANEE